MIYCYIYGPDGNFISWNWCWDEPWDGLSTTTIGSDTLLYFTTTIDSDTQTDFYTYGDPNNSDNYMVKCSIIVS